MNDHFDTEAYTWDQDPTRLERARQVANHMIDAIPETAGKTGLEFGCGTGLMSFCLKDHLSHVALVDSSEGMIDVLNKKISQQKIDHFKTFHIDFLELPEEVPPVDVIYSLLTLHHIRDFHKALQVSYDRLLPGGYLVVADLEEEDGSFHAHLPDYDLHNGFDPELIGELMEGIGLEVVHNEPCFTIFSDKSGEEKAYPLFMAIGKKNI